MVMSKYHNDDDDNDSCYETEDGNDDTDNDDNDGSVNTVKEKEENYDSAQDEEPVSNDMTREYDRKSISDSDN